MTDVEVANKLMGFKEKLNNLGFNAQDSVTVEHAEKQIEYYKANRVTEDFEGDPKDLKLKVVVKNGADVEACAEGCKYAWENVGDYPTDFKGMVASEDGSKNATFEYVGTHEEVYELAWDDYDYTIEAFKEFWKDDVFKKFNADKEVDFEVGAGVDDLQQMGKFIFDFVNVHTKLGSDIIINLIHPQGDKFALLVPANWSKERI